MQVPDLMKFTNNEKAVSPVIGVILMVAITVILAAIIAAFVFGMAGNISRTKLVAAMDQQIDATHIVVTYEGGQDAGTCTGVQWTIMDLSGSTETQAWMGTNTGATALAVGTVLTLPGTTARDHVVATAHFSDGTDQVILDNRI